MRNRRRLLLAVPGAALATAFPATADAASFHLWPHSQFTFSALNSPQQASGPNGAALTPQDQGASVRAARRFTWNALPGFEDSDARTQSNVQGLARHFRLQRFRLLGLNGTALIPMRAFEIGSHNRFFSGRLAVNADVFRYRYGGYRLTLPTARGYSGSMAVLPSVGASSRTTGADLQVAYELSSNDNVSVSASYAHARRSSLLTMIADRRITDVRSWQFMPSYEHLVRLAHDRSLAFDAAAIHRSSVRLLTQGSLIGITHPGERDVRSTRFDASLIYRSGPRLSVTAFVRNITDVHLDRSSTPFTTRDVVNPKTVSAVLSEPRTVGISLSQRL